MLFKVSCEFFDIFNWELEKNCIRNCLADCLSLWDFTYNHAQNSNGPVLCKSLKRQKVLPIIKVLHAQII